MVQAEQVVRDLATKGGQRKVLKQLGNFKPKLIANAKGAFANMEDGEVPLVIYDRSFFLNGKAGILITDRAIYSSSPRARLPLTSVQSAHVEKATMSQQMNGNNDIKLIVNGQVFYSQLASLGSNSAFLNFLADVTNALRANHGSSTSTIAAPSAQPAAAAPQDPIPITAGAICAGQTRDEILRTLTGMNVEPAQAATMVDGMQQLYSHRDTGKLKGQVLGGLALTVIGLALAVAVGVMQGAKFLMFGMQGVAVVGLIMFFTGGYRLLFGSPAPTASELAERWRAQQKK